VSSIEEESDKEGDDTGKSGGVVRQS